MSLFRFMCSVIAPVVFVLGLAAAGCDKGDSAKPQTSEQAKPTAPATQPIIPVAQMADWCPEHAMPESICVQCNTSLAAGFKAKGDWDEKHNVPKSQCFQCDPTLKSKFAAAYKEKYGKEPPAAAP